MSSIAQDTNFDGFDLCLLENHIVKINQERSFLI